MTTRLNVNKKEHDMGVDRKKGYQPKPLKQEVGRCSSRYAEWALDPITKRVMDCPVTIRAPCEHSLDKSSFVAWTKQGNTVCPICFTRMSQLSATYNKELAVKIQNLVSSNEPDINDIIFHPDMDCSSSSRTDSIEKLNASVQSLDWGLVFENDEDFPRKKDDNDPRVRLSQSLDWGKPGECYLAWKPPHQNTERISATNKEQKVSTSTSNSPPAASTKQRKLKRTIVFQKCAPAPNTQRVVKTSAIVNRLKSIHTRNPVKPTKAAVDLKANKIALFR